MWEAKDFIIEDGDATVAGFSEDGIKKAKAMTEESVLTFPETVTKIKDTAFKFEKIQNDLPEGIKGKVVFHGELTVVGKQAFQGNTKITAVEALEGESIEIGEDAFNPTNHTDGVEWNNGSGDFYNKIKSGMDDGTIGQSEISSLTINRKKMTIKSKAFLRSKIESLDFSAVVDSGSIHSFAFFGSSSLSRVTSFGMIGEIWGASFAACDLSELHISKNISTIRHRAFMDNPNLEIIHFDQRDGSPMIGVGSNAFAGTAVKASIIVDADGTQHTGDGVFRFPNCLVWMDGVDWVGGRNPSPGFANTKIKTLIFSDVLGHIGNNNFKNTPIETIENLSYEKSGDPRYPHLEGSAFANTKALKNISFRYNDGNGDNIPENGFIDGLLKSIEIPDYITNIAGNAYNENPGWIEGDTKVALYRKNADNAYVTDNAVADGDSFVINPVFVTYELKNQYGQAITKDLDLTVDVKRGTGTTSGVQVAEDGNKKDFKLGDSLTLKGTDIEGLTLKAVNGEEYKADTALTIDPTKTIEVIYGPDYKIGYKKFVISLTYNDPNAKDPNAVIYIEPIVPNNDTNNNNDNNSNNNNTDNTVSPSIIPNEDVSIDALPTEIVEEDIDIDGENTPLGANDIVEGEEEDLEIEGDETPLGKGKIDGKDGKKNTGILAKTGGLHVMLYQMLGLLAVLILGYFGFTFVAKKKKSER